MLHIILNPRKSLNKAFLKVKPLRIEIEHFKKNLIVLLDGLNKSESEEHNKNDLGNFLKNTFYQPRFYINTKDRTDLVIHNGSNSKSFAGVLIEAKKPSNKTEMITQDNLNHKAFHELILYYLRERITNHNLEIKHLIVTNIYEWFVFDAGFFEKTFAQNKTFVNQFTDFEEGRLAGKTTDFFYREIAEPFVAGLNVEISFTYFDFRNYDKPIRNENKKDDTLLIALYKLLSPEHLLKLPFANDSNSLDKTFYAELLHIMGLTETKEGSKKLIGRKKESDRNSGSLIEGAIVQLDSLEKMPRLNKPEQYGKTAQERLFNVALELSITWINRILFLKLLEAQLIKYHKGDKSFAFLNGEKVQNFDDLNSLFFSVLARKTDERINEVSAKFANVPYLNSSLFEPTDIEHACFFISQLKDRKLPVISTTVLKDNQGNKFKGELVTLDYIFRFLDAYDFAGEGSEEIQEENKTLINASVLGLIFEKINGYKDGSIFTPGFITMYICRETIRWAVVQKFNDVKGWNCKNLDDVYDKISDRNEANTIINSLKICDPAVGSGHLLVSALNEIIAIKSDLRILQDRDGRRLKEYHVEVVNDELVVTDEDGEFFEYNPTNNESQRIQQTLFHEKQTIIENCLFGVDINPNSVKICRLRLWIELLKNAYYRGIKTLHGTSLPLELETLPNIDINIKCGNSLVSRYALDADIRQVLKKSKWNIFSYRLAVMSYRNATTKDEKRELERLIALIKSDFLTELSLNHPLMKLRKKLRSKLDGLTSWVLFEPEMDYGNEDWKKKALENTQLTAGQLAEVDNQIADAMNNKIYENAFEWRFEFPEVLNDDGDFLGFDAVIGNPPYIVIIKSKHGAPILEYFNQNYSVSEYNPNTYALFVELALSKLLKPNGHLSFIIPNSWLSGVYFSKMRSFVFQNTNIELVNIKDKAFNEVVETVILISQNKRQSQFPTLKEYFGLNQFNKIERKFEVGINPFEQNVGSFIGELINTEESIKKHCVVYRGVETKNNSEWISNIKNGDEWMEILLGKDVSRYSYHFSGSYVRFLPKELKSNANIDYYNKPKILMRRTGNSIIACSDYKKTIALKNLYLIIPVKESFIPLILAQLNSKLFDFIHRTLTSGENKAFAQFPAHYVESLPCKINIDFIDRAKKLVETREQAKNDPTDIEFQIDQLVYELYGLTNEEIKIVEGTNK